jgi:hypothetical protein
MFLTTAETVLAGALVGVGGTVLGSVITARHTRHREYRQWLWEKRCDVYENAMIDAQEAADHRKRQTESYRPVEDTMWTVGPTANHRRVRASLQMFGSAEVQHAYKLLAKAHKRWGTNCGALKNAHSHVDRCVARGETPDWNEIYKANRGLQAAREAADSIHLAMIEAIQIEVEQSPQRIRKQRWRLSFANEKIRRLMPSKVRLDRPPHSERPVIRDSR